MPNSSSAISLDTNWTIYGGTSGSGTYMAYKSAITTGQVLTINVDVACDY